ncbi:MAG TPA: mechanosensitive ion channel domain-containing protein [Leptolyngbya sp.]|jgi:small-conductance mechanosensitive channel|nr:mechanosensitive ion channel domain-containing protein [Leptolyngbya sp.]
MELQVFNGMMVQRLLEELSGFFAIDLFTFGGKHFSLGSVVELLIQVGIVLIVSNVVKQLLKQRVFPGFGLEIGTRESLSTIVSYIITVIGIFVVVETTGINLSSLTVFAGATGIGFGIGLQNITSNFISGITLLFEQPIKVGDYIEVDQMAGIVEEISIRGTTIRTVNGVFVIVPNSRFLENSVVNWSYRDPKCRIAIAIAVIDESDSLTALEALLAAARQESRVLASPSPEVQFKGLDIEFSMLRFELLVWIERPIEMESIKSSLQFLIEAEFRDRGIDPKAAPTDIVLNDLPTIVQLLQNKEVQTDAIAPSKLPISGWLLRDLLRTVSYFQHCSDVELRQVIEKGYRQKLNAGEVIAREKDPGDAFYLILSGAVEVVVESINQQVAVRRSGEFIGEMSLLLGIPRSATLRTIEDTILFVVDYDNLQSLLSRHQELADQIASALSQRQETLKNLGVPVIETKEETAFEQIRKQIRSIFDL